jgi:hypothetical protein
VYEEVVEAKDAEEAERVAQGVCRDANGWGPDGSDPLVDLFARPAPVTLSPEALALLAALIYTPRDDVFARQATWDEVEAAFPKDLVPSEWDDEADGAEPPVYLARAS